MIHVAIISHGHETILINSRLGGLLEEKTRLTLWVKDNKPSAQLKAYCEQHAIHYTAASPGLGFGHNNNFLFQHIHATQPFQAKDVFVVMNPDISVRAEDLLALVERMQQEAHVLVAPNLYRDAELRIPDHNIRHFPGMLSILKMPLTNSFSETYDKDRIAEQTPSVEVEWASGAFLVFTPEHYAALGGFDPSYFMYFEDVDICYRSRQQLGKPVHYYPQFKAVHTAAHKNRNLASRHALWFFHSFFKFLVRRYLRLRPVYSQSQSELTIK